MKKVFLVAGLLSACLLSFLFSGCGKQSGDQKEFTALLDELETIKYVTEGQGDFMYALSDDQDIAEIKDLLSNADIEPVSFNSDEVGEIPTGGGSIDFQGSNGSRLACFVKNKSISKFDLVCFLYTKTGSQIYCFKLNDDTFQKVRGIVWKGEYVHITTELK